MSSWPSSGARTPRSRPRANATGDGAGGGLRGQSIYTRDPDGNLLEFIRYT